MEQQVTRAELKEALSAPTAGLSFLEKVVLALIDAHPVDDGRSRDGRLRSAIHAIQGEYYRHGKKAKDDRLLLLWMASQWAASEKRLPHLKIGPSLLGESDPPVKFANPTELARAALDRFEAWDGMSTERAQTQRLMDKFLADKENLIATVQNADPQPHVIEHKILQRLAGEFELTGVPFSPPSQPSAF